MAKLKGFIAVVFTLVLIVAVAFFPKAISILLDLKNNGTASLNPIASIRIELEKKHSLLGQAGHIE